MEPEIVDQYWDEYGKKYLSREIFNLYPETNIIPQYLLENFSDAEIVLDLGFGTGLWFWASFLPRLARIDGIDLRPEALAAADRLLMQERIPEGCALVHRKLGREFTAEDLKALGDRRGNFYFFDYTKPWPGEIHRGYYDLITEHGGGFGELESGKEFDDAVGRCAKALRKGGRLLFVNFEMNDGSGSRHLSLSEGLFARAAEKAGMELVDFHTVTV